MDIIIACFVSVKVVDPQFVGNDENDSGFYSGLAKLHIE